MPTAFPVWNQPVTDASAWLGQDLMRDSSWRVPLSSAQIEELQSAVQAARARGLSLTECTRAALPLPGLQPLLAEVSREVKEGRGFVLLQGLPVGQVSDEDIAWMYSALSLHLGTPVSQNAQAELLHSVHDRGLKPGMGSGRNYNGTHALTYHIDLADLVLLCCLRAAKRGGTSLLCSSSMVFNRLLEEAPQHLPALFAGYAWDRRDEHGPDEPPVSPAIPVFSEAEGKLSCVYNRGFIGGVAYRTGEPLEPARKAALDAFDEIAQRDSMVLRMDMQPGDVQVLNNYTVLHNRTAFEDHPDFEHKRRLLRLWLSVPGIRPFADEELLRFGKLRYGNLGLTGVELQARQSPLPVPR